MNATESKSLAHYRVKHAKRTIAILSLALAGCQGQIAPAAPTPTVTALHLFAENSTAPLLRELVAAYHPEHKLIDWDLQSGDFDALNAWLNKSDGTFALTNYLSAASVLWSTAIGTDGLALIVNTANPIANLSPDQLRAIFTGRALNWKIVGGADLPINVASREPGSSDGAWFASLILGERRVSGAARLATTAESVVSIVVADPSAIGYVPMRLTVGNAAIHTVPIDQRLPTPVTVADASYGLRSPLLFVGQNAPSNDAYRDFFVWTQSPPGQAIVAKWYAPLKLD